MVDPNTSLLIKTVVRKHLPDPKYRLFIFGSRSQKKHRPFSDIDVGISGPIPVPSQVLANIQEELENSDLPYIAQLVDFSQTSGSFNNKALQNTISL